MSNQRDSEPKPDRAMVYEIRINGHLGPQWAAWFEGMSVTLEESGVTLLTGPVVDQAELHGLLKKVRDLGLTLLSVTCVESLDAAEPGEDR